MILASLMPGTLYPKDKEKKFTVVIDAGHGGKDIGATDNGVKEKDINLKVAKRLEALIKKKMKDTNVVMTRDNDTYLTLQERADKANKAQGDLFISIHTNSVAKKNKNRKKVAGSSVYTLGLHKDENNLQVARRENSVIELESDYEQKYSGFDPQKDESYIIFEMAQKKNLSQSIKFADAVEKELVSKGRQERGVHQAGFWVLWATSMPAVLIELDFICNPESAKYMSSDKGAEELADAIFKAIEKYESSWNGKLQVASDENDAYSDGLQVTKDKPQIARDESKVLSNEKEATFVNLSGRKRRSKNGRLAQNNISYEYSGLNLPAGNGNEYFAMADEKQPVVSEKVKEDTGNESKDKDKKGKEKKKKEKKVKEKKQKNKSKAKVNKLVTVYKIQILASEDLLNENNTRFCGLTPVTTFKENNLYKYYYGESTDKEDMERLLPQVREKIPDAFIVSSTKSDQKQSN